MTTPGYYNGGKKLEEGHTYLFRVHGFVTLQDERVYLILEDPYSIRHLLPSWHFTRYDIKQGQTITCFVDKINCTGRVYLEPEHPFYKSGAVYELQLLAIHRPEYRKKARLILADIFGNDIEVDCPWEFEDIIEQQQKVACTVMRMHKGKPVLVLAKAFKEKMKMKLESIPQETADQHPSK